MFRFYKNVLIPVRNIATFFYIFVSPLIETPNWCLEAYERRYGTEATRTDFSIYCHRKSNETPYSGVFNAGVIY